MSEEKSKTKKEAWPEVYFEYNIDLEGAIEKRPRINWESLLTEDDYHKSDDQQYIRLSGLEKLAKLRGVVDIKTQIVETVIVKDSGLVQVKATYVFRDGDSASGLADASTRNSGDDKYAKYLTALAQSRAKARALRNAFFIKQCSLEQVDSVESKFASSEASQQQIKFIDKLCEEKGIDKQTYLKQEFGISEEAKMTKKVGVQVIEALKKAKKK